MRRRSFLGSAGVLGISGCIGVDSGDGGSGGGGYGGGGDGSTDSGDFAGGEATTTATESVDYPPIDQQRAEIRNQLNGRRVDEGVGALDVNSQDASTLRKLANSHARQMSQATTVSMELDGRGLDRVVEQQYGTCQVRVDGKMLSGGETIFLGKVGFENLARPEVAAEEFLDEWLSKIDTRPVLLSGDARFLGLGLAYGEDGLYVAMILC